MPDGDRFTELFRSLILHYELPANKSEDMLHRIITQRRNSPPLPLPEPLRGQSRDPPQSIGSR